jgi:hypothetical protein
MFEAGARFRLYRLTSPVLAVRRAGTQNELFTVHPGSTVLATAEARQSGFVDALVDGEFVCVFLRDVEDCGELVNVQASSV